MRAPHSHLVSRCENGCQAKKEGIGGEKEERVREGENCRGDVAGDEAAKWGNGAQADKRGVRVCVCAGVWQMERV